MFSKEGYVRGRKITFQVQELGNDICVLCYGGDKSHIGTILWSVPHPAADNNQRSSCTSSSINFPGHREESVSRLISEALSKSLKKKVVCLCGIHYDVFSGDDLITEIEEFITCAIKEYIGISFGA